VTKSRDDSQFDADHQVGCQQRQVQVRDEEGKGREGYAMTLPERSSLR
jgi:hypothetical protein